MFAGMAWFLAAGCRDGGAGPQVPLGCEGIDSEPALQGDTVAVGPDACGAASLGGAVLLGDQAMSVELAVSGGLVVPQVTAGPGGAVFRGLHLEGRLSVVGAEPLRLWRQGYQSWSASGVFEPEPLALDADGLPELGGDAGGFDVLAERPGTSWWAGLAGRSGGGSALIGAVRAHRTKVAVAFEDETVHVVWGGRGEEIRLDPGEVLELDPLMIAVGSDPSALWRRWADRVAEESEVVLPDPPPVGWSTWYQYYDAVSEQDVLDNLALAAAGPAGTAPIGLFQLDDGWEVAWGEWTANERFPSGMAALASQIRAAGMRPGLWMAPFYVSRQTDTYQAHPDWFVRGLDGNELDYQGNAALDVTHPDAAAWLHRAIRERVDEGFDYLKLDFLYAGAEEGQRRDDVTGIEAYRLGLSLIRDAAGPDTFILACGAPLLPTVGFAQSYRTGPDIAFTLEPDPRRPFLRNQVRSTAARGFTNGRLWWVDADALLVRSPFTEDDARGSVVSMAVSGGAWLLGDDLTALDPQRLAWALDPTAASTVGLDVTPGDPLSYPSGWDATPLLELVQGDDRVPERWTLSNGWTALLNLSDAPIALDGPGGTEVLTGEAAGPGARTLAPGLGELWQPVE